MKIKRTKISNKITRCIDFIEVNEPLVSHVEWVAGNAVNEKRKIWREKNSGTWPKTNVKVTVAKKIQFKCRLSRKFAKYADNSNISSHTFAK